MYLSKIDWFGFSKQSPMRCPHTFFFAWRTISIFIKFRAICSFPLHLVSRTDANLAPQGPGGNNATSYDKSQAWFQARTLCTNTWLFKFPPGPIYYGPADTETNNLVFASNHSLDFRLLQRFASKDPFLFPSWWWWPRFSNKLSCGLFLAYRNPSNS